MPPKKIQRLSQNVENDSETEDNMDVDDVASNADLQQKSNDIVRFMLDCHVKNIPVKKADLSKGIMANFKHDVDICFDTACRRLEEVFGIKAVEMKSKRRHYLLINSLEKSVRPISLENTEDENAKFGLLSAILTFLFMNNPENPSSNEKELGKFLRKLNVDLSEKSNSVFGDVKNLLHREFVAQQYLQVKKADNCLEYFWGERAEIEFSKKYGLDLFCNVYNNIQSPEDWANHYAEVAKENEDVVDENEER